MPKNTWTPIALTPLSGMLDTRSRPAELVPGSLRYKLNFAVNRTGSLCTRSGHAALNFGLRSDNPAALPNWDFHRRGVAREPVNLLFESTATDGTRRLFSGSRGYLSLLNNGTSEWSTIASGTLSDHNWKAAELQDKVMFVNQHQTNGVKLFSVTGTDITNTIVWNPGGAVTTAKIVVSFSGVLMLMNVTYGGSPISSRIVWSDYLDASLYRIDAGGPSIAGYQDLDYGDDILNAVEMLGALYIFTTRSIWRCVLSVNSTTGTIFNFQKIYSEPKNQTGCLAYPNSLVTSGRELYWLGRDSLWTFNPYLVAPECPEWMLKGTGALYSEDNSDRMERRCCEAVIGEYHPVSKELWFSYPQPDIDTPSCINTRCLVANTEFKTMDLVDHGYTAFVNYRRITTRAAAADCASDQTFIGADSVDYCLKSIGEVFHREMVNVIGGDAETDIPDVGYSTTLQGYFCRVVGEVPLGFPDREKIVRSINLDRVVTPNTLASPNLITLRVGNSFALQDPMSIDPYCAVMWHEVDPLPLACPDLVTLASMLADNLRPSDSDPAGWNILEQGHRIYFDLRITAASGGAPVDHDAAFSAIRFEAMIN